MITLVSGIASMFDTTPHSEMVAKCQIANGKLKIVIRAELKDKNKNPRTNGIWPIWPPVI